MLYEDCERIMLCGMLFDNNEAHCPFDVWHHTCVQYLLMHRRFCLFSLVPDNSLPKRGKEGRTVVSYSGSYSIQQYTDNYDVYNLKEWMNAMNTATWDLWMYENNVYPYGNRTLQEAIDSPKNGVAYKLSREDRWPVLCRICYSRTFSDSIRCRYLPWLRCNPLLCPHPSCSVRRWHV